MIESSLHQIVHCGNNFKEPILVFIVILHTIKVINARVLKKLCRSSGEHF